MVLSDQTIQSLLNNASMKIQPLGTKQIQPASVDLRLGNHFLKAMPNEDNCFNIAQAMAYEEIIAERMTIPPKSFLLATTKEYIELPNFLTAFVEGRSSIGRMGLFIQNAGWVDPGFAGQITLELFNANDIAVVIEEGIRICQLVFVKTDLPVANAYNGKYKYQKNAVGSKIYLDQDRE